MELFLFQYVVSSFQYARCGRLMRQVLKLTMNAQRTSCSIQGNRWVLMLRSVSLVLSLVWLSLCLRWLSCSDISKLATIQRYLRNVGHVKISFRNFLGWFPEEEYEIHPKHDSHNVVPIIRASQQMWRLLCVDINELRCKSVIFKGSVTSR